MKDLHELLGIGPGITALLGGGGKTTLMYRLAEELSRCGSVILATSTKIRRPDGFPVAEDPSPAELSRLAAQGPVCVGTPAAEGKLAAPKLSFAALEGAADYVLVEADGARGLPVKAHAAWEPVIPDGTRRSVLVVGADCFGQPVGGICHRPERFCQLAGCELTDSVTPERVAAVIRAEGYGNILSVNKCETEAAWASARELGRRTALPAAAGSLWREEWQCLY